jgi:predicted nucleic acid-binding protein
MFGLLSLARAYRLTVYDAAYLELARRAGIDLATLDGQLINAAKTEKVTLVGG